MSDTQDIASHPAAQLIFITWASSGLGQALALEYFEQGWRFALVARRVQVIDEWLKQNSIPAEWTSVYAADVAEPQSIKSVAEQCMAQQGLPQVVIACAGISNGVDTAIWEDLAFKQRIWTTNNLGLGATFHPFGQPMICRGCGTLVGIASVAGIRGLPGHGAYSASKAGVIVYCESLQGELRATGVKVTTISPGFIATPMTAENPFPMPFLMPANKFTAKAFQTIEKTIELSRDSMENGRLVQIVAPVAQLVVWLGFGR